MRPKPKIPEWLRPMTIFVVVFKVKKISQIICDENSHSVYHSRLKRVVPEHFLSIPESFVLTSW